MTRVMKRLCICAAMALLCAASGMAQEIRFNKTTHDFGKFPAKKPVVTCDFVFTNTGNKPLVINQAVASCGCTASEYTKTPIMPGKNGVIRVTYNGTNRFPGAFKKAITVRSNAQKNEIVRLYIIGDMTK